MGDARGADLDLRLRCFVLTRLRVRVCIIRGRVTSSSATVYVFPSTNGGESIDHVTTLYGVIPVLNVNVVMDVQDNAFLRGRNRVTVRAHSLRDRGATVRSTFHVFYAVPRYLITVEHDQFGIRQAAQRARRRSGAWCMCGLFRRRRGLEFGPVRAIFELKCSCGSRQSTIVSKSRGSGSRGIEEFYPLACVSGPSVQTNSDRHLKGTCIGYVFFVLECLTFQDRFIRKVGLSKTSMCIIEDKDFRFLLSSIRRSITRSRIAPTPLLGNATELTMK